MTDEIKNAKLWVTVLAQARAGISLKCLTLRQPSQIAISYSCPFGLGGFTCSGRVWRLIVPQNSSLHGDYIANNFLEFLAMVITIWLVLLECEETGLEDNTSAIGWLYKTKGVKPDSLYYEAVTLVARKLASLVTKSGHCLASQHCRGEYNVVSGLLSFQGTDRKSEASSKTHTLAPDSPSNSEPTRRFHLHLPQLIPRGFEISQLPDEIGCFVTQAMKTAELSWIRSRNVPTKRSTEYGTDGCNFARTRWEISTHSSMMNPQQMSDCSFAPSSKDIAELTSIQTDPFVESVRLKVPQAVYLRSSGTTPPAVAKRPPSTHAHACVSPFTTEPTVPALSTLGSYGRGSTRGNYRPHNIPQRVTAFKTFAKVNNAMHEYTGGSHGHTVKMPSAASQVQVDTMKSRPRQHQELIEIDDESSMASSNQHPETLKNSSYETPRTALINGLANEMIGRTADHVLNVDYKSVGTPDSSFGKDVVHYFSIGDDIKKNVAHVVLEKKQNTVAQDLMDVLNTMLPFPSMENKKKKDKSEKGHLEKKKTTYGKWK